MFTIYAIYNSRHQKMYIGQTGDLLNRLKAHNDQRFIHSYTSRFDGRWEVIYKEEVSSRGTAIKREKQLKSYRGREFVKQFIPG